MNYYYFCKSNIRVTDLIVGSRNMIDVFTKYRQFLNIFYCFRWTSFFESAMDKYEVIFNAKLRPNFFSVNVTLLAVVFGRQISKKRLFYMKFCAHSKTIKDAKKCLVFGKN